MRTQNDGGGTDVSREEKISGRVRGLREGGGVRVTGHTPNGTAWEDPQKMWNWTDAATGGGGGGEPTTYRIEFPKGGTRECPTEGCPARAGTRTAMRVNF